MGTVKYKILIADDEYWTREKLRNLISWEEYGLEFMEPAIDGEDVLNKISHEKPDILITDINMPFVNGVELLNILKEKYPEIVTFVISGYDDFQYVKEAFMAGTINYLIKPVTTIDLVQALTKALEIISSRQTEQEEILKAASLIQDREFSLMIKKEEAPFAPAVYDEGAGKFAGTSLMLIKIHSLRVLANVYQYDINGLSYAVKKEIRKIIGDESVLVFNHIYRSNEFIVISDMEDDVLERLANKLIVMLSGVARTIITICISGHSYTTDGIHIAYVETVALYMTRSYTSKCEVIVGTDQKTIKDTSGITGKVSEEQVRQLRSLLQSGNLPAVRKMIFHSIGLADCGEQRWGYLEVKQTVKRIVNILFDSAVNHMRPKEIVDMESLTDQIDKTIELLDSSALCEAIDDMIEMALSEKREAASDSMKEIVKQAVIYIDEHFFEEISLTLMTERFNVEGSYFSKVFRQQIGETFMVYITKRRIEKAKQYMKNMSVNLTEVAFMTGYDDYSYFSRVFRKMVGMSPREYRNKLAGE